MGYNKKAIGERIRIERKRAGFKNQNDLALALNYSESSRQTIGNWENGKSLPNFEDMLKLCDIFDCELGYLLCEYDCKRRENADVQELTGLSEKSITMLKRINSSEYKSTLDTLSKIIEHKKFIHLLKALYSYIDNKKYKRNIYDHDDINDALAEYDCCYSRSDDISEIENYLSTISELEIELSKIWGCDRDVVPDYIKSSTLNYIENTLNEICNDLIQSDENT